MLRIAVAPCERLGDYDRALRLVDADPWRLSLGLDAPTDLIAHADGLVLTGGGDVHPSLYGEAPHSTFVAAEAGRDAFEVAAARHALMSGLPLLAICRGVQVLNVACGGSLIQDLPSQFESEIPHRVHPPSTALAHEVRLQPGSRLASLRSATDPLWVNSRHHQAVGALGSGLVATAHAPDGVVEGIEAPAHAFCVGVQWHPENFYATGAFDWLFRGFMQACQAHRARRPLPHGP